MTKELSRGWRSSLSTHRTAREKMPRSYASSSRQLEVGHGMCLKRRSSTKMTMSSSVS